MIKSPVGGARPLSRHVPGPPDLRFYMDDRVMAWQPHGVLDDVRMDEIAAWLALIEKSLLPFKRFVDFSRLTKVSVRVDHVFKFARRRAREYSGASPVRTALYCDTPVGYGVASLYESLMENTSIKARAFRDLPSAAEWLGVPVKILKLEDKPGFHV